MKEKVVVITGALGHIGSALIRSLGCSTIPLKIILIDNLKTSRYPSLFNLSTNSKFQFIEYDVRESLTDLIQERVDYVIHLAALTEPALSAKKPKEFIGYNEECTKNIINFSIANNAKLVMISSTSVYTSSGLDLTELDLEMDSSGQTPYSLCKLKEESIIRNAIIEDNLSATILRFGTIYGPSIGMRFHTAVNKFCWEAALNKPLSVWATAMNQMRPYLDLNDAIRAIIYCISKDSTNNETFNIVTNNSSLREIVETIKIHKANVKVKIVNSPIMNTLSYTLSKEKSLSFGFILKGSLDKAIQDTLSLLSGISNS